MLKELHVLDVSLLIDIVAKTRSMPLSSPTGLPGTVASTTHSAYTMQTRA